MSEASFVSRLQTMPTPPLPPALVEPVLSPAMQRFVLHWGDMGARWGVSRSVAQIHAALYLSPRPLSADDLVRMLEIARSNVSTSLKELQGWNLIQRQSVIGDRRDYFVTQRDPWDLFFVIVEERKKREIDPTIEMLQGCLAEAEAGGAAEAETATRIRDMLDFIQGMNDWYVRMRSVPRPILKMLVMLGDRVVKFVPKKKLRGSDED